MMLNGGRAANGRILSPPPALVDFWTRVYHGCGKSGAIPHAITSKIILHGMSVP
jgi:hypothetical protein